MTCIQPIDPGAYVPVKPRNKSWKASEGTSLPSLESPVGSDYMFATYVTPSKRSLGIKGNRPRTMSLTVITPIAVYLYAGNQIIENVTTGYFYYPDSLGNTSHVTDSAGHLLERYTYDAFGKPTFYNAAGTLLPAGSNYGIRHLFHGQLWTQETGLNDHRYRQALPAMGIFMQPDPIGFAGDRTNLYRYCGNNSVNWLDPFGLLESGGGAGGRPPVPILSLNGTATTERIVITADPIFDINAPFHDMQGWVSANSPLGMLGFPNLGGVSFTLTGTASFTPLFSTPTLGVHSLPPVPSVPVFHPSPDATNLPRSGGLLYTASANLGLIYGAGANVSQAYGLYSNDKPGGWESNGAMLGGPTGAYSHVDPQSVNQIPLIVGGGVSIAGGAWFSNAATRQDLMGPFASFGVDTPWFSSTYSTDRNGIYVITVAYGLPPSAAVTSYPTDTKPLGGH